MNRELKDKALKQALRFRARIQYSLSLHASLE